MGRRGFVLLAGAQTLTQTHANPFSGVLGVMHEGESKTALAITRKMAQENYNIDEIQLISNFFERRNQNSISHTNQNDIGVWGVNSIEYTEYKNNVLPILTKLNISLN